MPIFIYVVGTGYHNLPANAAFTNLGLVTLDLADDAHSEYLEWHLDYILRDENLGEAGWILGQIQAELYARYEWEESDPHIERLQGFADFLLDELDGYINHLITKLTYDAMRHEEASEECQKTREYLENLDPEFEQYSMEDFREYLHDKEAEDGDFFGGYQSADSDDEFEILRDQIPQPTYRAKRNGIFPVANAVHKNMCGVKHPIRIFKNKDPAFYSEDYFRTKVSDNAKIHHNFGADTEQIKQDLKTINAALLSGENNVDTLTKTKFCVAQYRGIHYNVLTFGAASRQRNRESYELFKPVYCSAVFDLANVSEGDYYAGNVPEYIEEQLANAAMELQDVLQQKRIPKPVNFRGRIYECPAFALQDYYSKSYDDFFGLLERAIRHSKSKRMKMELSNEIEDHSGDFLPDFLMNEDPMNKEKEDESSSSSSSSFEDDTEYIFEGLKSSRNPFVSTGNTPRHALRYAYGVKYYDSHKHERLRPRYRKTGRSEFPYSGKVYVSLHPISDYLVLNPLDVVALNRNGMACVNIMIAQERETTFPAFIPSDRVVLEHIARYPGFHHSEYKEIFEHKYGLNEACYNALREIIVNSDPHSEDRKKAKKGLGEFLCRYCEPRLIESTRRIAERRGMVLVYRDENGLLSLNLSKDVMPVKMKAAKSGGSSSDEMKDSNSLDEFLEMSGLELKSKEMAPRLKSAKARGFTQMRSNFIRRFNHRNFVGERFTVHQVLGDGNCLFHAVGAAVDAFFETNVPDCDYDLRHDALRDLAVQQAQWHVDHEGIQLPAGYFNDMAQVSDAPWQYERWGTDREVQFLASALRFNIRVYDPTAPGGHTDVVPSTGDAGRWIYLFHTNGNHWEWLTPNDFHVLFDGFDG